MNGKWNGNLIAKDFVYVNSLIFVHCNLKLIPYLFDHKEFYFSFRYIFL